jgi:hypothetical protein
MGNIIEFLVEENVLIKITEYDPSSGGSLRHNSDEPPYSPEIINYEIFVIDEGKEIEMPETIANDYFKDHEEKIYKDFLERL